LPSFRRDFLRQFAQFAAEAGLLFYGVRINMGVGKDPAKGNESPGGSDYDWNMHYYGMVINLSKCIGCCTCMRTCRDENDLGDQGFRTWVERYTIYDDNTVSIDVPAFRENHGKALQNPLYQLHYPPAGTEKAVRERFFVPKLCNHCAKPPCVQVCPVGATFQTLDGVVLIDHDSCVGCGYCIQSCPYGARFWDEEKLCANKCSFCYHRITKGLSTACVQACPTGARVFGDFKDPNSPIYDAIHKEKATILKRLLGTEPKVYYTDIHEEIV
jgi:Fe-S-cluster-containing dehydrogenase component